MTSKQVVALTLALVLTAGLSEAFTTFLQPTIHYSLQQQHQLPHQQQQQQPQQQHHHHQDHDNDQHHQQQQQQQQQQLVESPHSERAALVETHGDTQTVVDAPQQVAPLSRQPLFSAASSVQLPSPALPMPMVPTVFQLFRNPLWPFFRPASYRNYGFSAMPLQQASMGFHYGGPAWPTFSTLSRTSVSAHGHGHLNANGHQHNLEPSTTNSSLPTNATQGQERTVQSVQVSGEASGSVPPAKAQKLHEHLEYRPRTERQPQEESSVKASQA